MREHERMNAMGQRVVVVDSIEGVEELLACVGMTPAHWPEGHSKSRDTAFTRRAVAPVVKKPPKKRAPQAPRGWPGEPHQTRP